METKAMTRNLTASQLRARVNATGSHFFSPSTMRFFGDTMKNYGVRLVHLMSGGELVTAYELYRRRPVNGGLKDSAFFAADDFRRVWPD